MQSLTGSLYATVWSLWFAQAKADPNTLKNLFQKVFQIPVLETQSTFSPQINKTLLTPKHEDMFHKVLEAGYQQYCGTKQSPPPTFRQ